MVTILQHEMHVEYFEWATESKMKLSRSLMWILLGSPSCKKLLCSVSQITAGCSPLFPLGRCLLIISQVFGFTGYRSVTC